MSTALNLFIGNNSQVLELEYLQDHNDVHITDASLTYEVADSTGAVILSGVMSYVSGSNSVYQASINGSPLVEDAEYDITITGNGGGLSIDLTHTVTAILRTT